MNSRLGQLLWVLLPSFLLLIWAGMQVDVMEVDSAQYASIAREMLHNGVVGDLRAQPNLQFKGLP